MNIETVKGAYLDAADLAWLGALVASCNADNKTKIAMLNMEKELRRRATKKSVGR